jgi:hypothetical protein
MAPVMKLALHEYHILTVYGRRLNLMPTSCLTFNARNPHLSIFNRMTKGKTGEEGRASRKNSKTLRLL